MPPASLLGSTSSLPRTFSKNFLELSSSCNLGYCRAPLLFLSGPRVTPFPLGSQGYTLPLLGPKVISFSLLGPRVTPFLLGSQGHPLFFLGARATFL